MLQRRMERPNTDLGRRKGAKPKRRNNSSQIALTERWNPSWRQSDLATSFDFSEEFLRAKSAAQDKLLEFRSLCKEARSCNSFGVCNGDFKGCGWI